MTESEKKNRVPVLATFAFLIAGFFVAFLRFRSLRDGTKKDFLRLLFVWGGVFFVLSIPVAFQLRPRFFLVILPIPFLLWGLLFEYMREQWKRVGSLLGIILFFLLFGWNVKGVIEWFNEQASSQKGDIPVSRTLILKNKDGVTLGQLERTAEYMYSRIKKGERLYFYVKPEHVAPLEYLLEQKQKTDSDFAFRNIQTVPADPLARFFAVVPAEQTELQSVIDKFDESFAILDFKVVGQIAVAEISFSNRIVDSNFMFQGKDSEDGMAPWLKKRRTSDRVFWGDVFFGDSTHTILLNKGSEDISEDKE